MSRAKYQWSDSIDAIVCGDEVVASFAPATLSEREVVGDPCLRRGVGQALTECMNLLLDLNCGIRGES